MSPYQHGEVYVTEDGAETDLDLGHYERFMCTAAGAVTGKPVKVMKFHREMAAQMEALNMDPSTLLPA